jgi:hypothetical protein
MRSIALLAIAALLGCTEPGAERNEEAAAAPAVATKSRTSDPGATAEQPSQQPPDISDGEQRECGADKYRYLIGKHRSEIPKEPAGAAWRITCTSCAITQDYSPGRLNIFYDEESGIVKEVRCG